MSKKVLFRVDASLEIGTGHVMRCITIAKVFKQHGFISTFICREHKGNLGNFIKNEGFDLFFLPASDLSYDFSSSGLAHADWLGVDMAVDIAQTLSVAKHCGADYLVVDHYGIDYRWEVAARELNLKIIVIDDLADRTHDCDFLLDQNLGTDPEHYTDLIPSHCQKLIGPTFSLLRPEFAKWRDFSLNRRKSPSLNTMLISMGGVDQKNLSLAFLNVLANSFLGKKITVSVVLGSCSPWLDSILAVKDSYDFIVNVLVDVKNIAEIMANSDFAIGAAGTTAWERCCLGVPSLTMVIADNQKKVAAALAEKKATILYNQRLTMEENVELALDINKYKELSSASAAIIDGLGANRVVERILYG